MTESDPSNCSSHPAKDGPDRACSGCVHEDQCRRVWSEPNRGPFSPTGLSLASVTAFLLPLFSAILWGAVVTIFVKDSPHRLWWQITAVIVGFVDGVIAARFITPAIRKHFNAEKTTEHHRRD